jgi:pimeloyl-ACP methyl ester carboxylesterase
MKASQILGKIIGWIGKILLGLVGLLLIFIIVGLIREVVTRNKYHKQYPAPGEMVTVGDHQLHLNCVGEGSPTVLFESDLDQYGSLSWYSVQGEVGKFTRACSYDRAGILWSETGPRPRDGETIAAELKTLLANAGEEAPYLLVGHAFGGAYLRIFAGENPDDVYGMVLVESSHPEMITRMAELGLPQEIPDKGIRPLILLLSHLGSPGRYKGNIYDLPLEVYDPVQAYMPESSLTWFDEKVEAESTLAQAGQYQYLGDFPLIVIVSAKPTVSVEGGEEFDALWLELQYELLDLSGNSEIRITQLGHYPQYDGADLVIEAIRDIIEARE